MRRALLALALLVAPLATSCAPPTAEAAVAVAARLSAPGDSVELVVTVQLPTVADGRGPLDGWRARAVRTRPAPTASFSGATRAPSVSVDTLRVPLGTTLAVGDSAVGTACVATVRRTLTSSEVCAPWSAVFGDRAPPPPDSVIVNPRARVIGLRILPDSVTVAAAGTVQFCAFAIMADSSVALTEPRSAYCDGVYLQAVPISRRASTVGTWG